MSKSLFPELPKPADLRLMTDEELDSLLAAHQGVAKKISEKDEDTLRSLSQKELLDQYERGVEQIQKIREEQVARGAADEEFESRVKDLSEKAGVAVDEPTDEEKATPEVEEEAAKIEEVAEVAAEAQASEDATDGESVVEVVAEVESIVETPAVEIAEPVLAAAEPPAPMEVRRPPLPRPRAENRPIAVSDAAPALVASSGLNGVKEGTELDRMGLAQAMTTLRYQKLSAPPGFSDNAVVASIDYGSRFPEARRLTGDYESDQLKLNAVVGEEALVASGGLCAPVTPYYELMNVATAARPVRDALAGFNAVRGGLNFAAPPTIADVTDGVGIKTAAQDAAGGTFAVKTCQVVDCPPFSEVQLSMIYHCVQFGNLNSRAFPEQVAQFNDLVMAAHARLAETALLDGIAAASTDVDGAKIYGATSTIIDHVLYAAAGMRSRHRMPLGARFRALFPAWARELIAADVVNTQFERFGIAPGDVDALLRRYGVEPTWYLDGATGAGQVFAAQPAGPLRDFPGEVVWYIYPEGSFLFLDGGVLDLGIVRDSTLNTTNDFQIFGETFENVAFVGPESLEVTSTVCNDGTVAIPATAIVCSAS